MEDRVAGQRINVDEGCVNGEDVLGVIDVICIHVRTLEEVDTHRRRLVTIGFRFTATIDLFTVIAVAETTFDVAAHVVVLGETEVHVSPGAEVGASEFVCGAVDNFVGAERHVVDFVVGCEAKGLGTDFETDGSTHGFGV